MLSKVDLKAKKEKSQQAAKECRVRKNVRLQYIGDFVANKEQAIFALRKDLEKVNINFNSSCSFKNEIDILNYAELRDGQNMKKRSILFYRAISLSAKEMSNEFTI